jgi:phage terminase Nu1 subunit (DNA packaging protein)
MSSKNATILEKIDPESCPTKSLSMLLGVTTQAIDKWREEGCPHQAPRGRRRQFHFSVPGVWSWHRARLKDLYQDQAADAKHAEETQRLKNQNSLLEVRIQKARDETIDRHTVEQVAKEQAIALRTFWTDAWKRNINALLTAMGSAPENAGRVLDVVDGFVKEALEAFVEGSRPITPHTELDAGETGEPIKTE